MTILMLLSYHFDHDPFVSPSVELGVEDALPGTQVESAIGDRQHDLVVDEQRLEVGVPVVLARAMVAVVRMVVLKVR
jgi:hypothetical protein